MAKHTVAARCERRAKFRGATADTVWDSADTAVGACPTVCRCRRCPTLVSQISHCPHSGDSRIIFFTTSMEAQMSSTLDPENLVPSGNQVPVKGHDVRSLGPSDSSDSGSDMAGPGLVNDD